MDAPDLSPATNAEPLHTYSEKIRGLEKRIEDGRAYLQLLVTAGSALSAGLFVVLTIAVKWDLSSEREQLKNLRIELKEEIKERLETNNFDPKLRLLSLDGTALQGQVFSPQEIFRDQEGKYGIPIFFRIENHGSTSSGKIWIKGFTKEPLIPKNASFLTGTYRNSGVKPFHFEYHDPTGDDDFSDLPGGGFGKGRSNILWLAHEVGQPLPGDYPYKVAIYTERGLESEASVTLRIPKNVGLLEWKW